MGLFFRSPIYPTASLVASEKQEDIDIQVRVIWKANWLFGILFRFEICNSLAVALKWFLSFGSWFIKTERGVCSLVGETLLLLTFGILGSKAVLTMSRFSRTPTCNCSTWIAYLQYSNRCFPVVTVLY